MNNQLSQEFNSARNSESRPEITQGMRKTVPDYEYKIKQIFSNQIKYIFMM